MKIAIKYILFIIIILSLGCKKDGDTSSDGKTVTDVYFTGYIVNDANAIATLWKNNSALQIPKSTGYSMSSDITSNGNDIYVSGYYRAKNGKDVAVYWKNGEMTKLSDSTAYYTTTSIAVNGSDIYVAGYYSLKNFGFIKTVPVYWKNGTLIALDLGSAIIGVANSIVIQNSNIYIAGNLDGGTAIYWKNGDIITLPASNGFSLANSIMVNGNDVYVVGDTGAGYNPNVSMSNAAVYWKNGVPTMLGSNGSHAMDITMQGSDIYIAGSINNSSNNLARATYWKNGTPIILQNTPNLSEAFGIAVNSTDVYVVGKDAIFGAMCWRNGESIKLSNTSSSTAYAAIVLTQVTR